MVTSGDACRSMPAVLVIASCPYKLSIVDRFLLQIYLRDDNFPTETTFANISLIVHRANEILCIAIVFSVHVLDTVNRFGKQNCQTKARSTDVTIV